MPYDFSNFQPTSREEWIRAAEMSRESDLNDFSSLCEQNDELFGGPVDPEDYRNGLDAIAESNLDALSQAGCDVEIVSDLKEGWMFDNSILEDFHRNVIDRGETPDYESSLWSDERAAAREQNASKNLDPKEQSEPEPGSKRTGPELEESNERKPLSKQEAAQLDEASFLARDEDQEKFYEGFRKHEKETGERMSPEDMRKGLEKIDAVNAKAMDRLGLPSDFVEEKKKEWAAQTDEAVEKESAFQEQQAKMRDDDTSWYKKRKEPPDAGDGDGGGRARPDPERKDD